MRTFTLLHLVMALAVFDTALGAAVQSPSDEARDTDMSRSTRQIKHAGDGSSTHVEKRATYANAWCYYAPYLWGCDDTSSSSSSSSVAPTTTTKTTATTTTTTTAPATTTSADPWANFNQFNWNNWVGWGWYGYTLDYVKAWYT
jgi:hypothetical protein